MRLYVPLMLAMTLAAITAGARAQEPPVYVVTYIEVAPKDAAAAAGLLRQLATASRKDDGSSRFDVLQGRTRSNQFAIVSIWKDQKAHDAHSASAQAKEFRDKIKPHLISAIDERTHTGLDIAADAGKGAPNAVYVVTHVDVPPPSKDKCVAALKALVGDSRKEKGSVRFDVFQQGSRPNHFSVVEIWKDQTAYDAHVTATHTKAFRDELTPMSGALYDERLYKAL